MPKKKKITPKDFSTPPEEVFNVDNILDRRVGTGGRVEYLLKWENHPESSNTWEPEGNLRCPDLIAAYEMKHDQADNLETATTSPSVKRRKTVASGASNMYKGKMSGVGLSIISFLFNVNV